jgi:hypothetical protein
VCAMRDSTERLFLEPHGRAETPMCSPASRPARPGPMQRTAPSFPYNS